MLNYLPVPDGPGLALSEVQTLMGHARTESTAIYAREDRDILSAKIELADWHVNRDDGRANPTSTILYHST